MTAPNIQHLDDLDTYEPPGHAGTVNRRLVDRSFGGGFELVLGRVEPGGLAERHHHTDEAQAFYIIAGEADLTLGDGPTTRCGPGTVVRIPPKLDHKVVSVGDRELEVIIVYSPPLGGPPVLT